MKVKNEKTGKIEDKRLPKIFKDKWLKALRSGEYKQADGRLEDINIITGEKSYCCLGFACRIQHPNLILNGGYIELQVFKERLKNIKVPSILKGNSFNIIVSKLSGMNDKGDSFKKIATWIEENL